MPCENTASSSPFLKDSMPVAASATTLKITRSTYGRPLRKYFGLASNERKSDRCHSLRTNGPVPTGFVRYGFFWGSVPAQRCFGKIPSWEMPCIKRTFGPLNLRTAVYLFGVSTFLRFGTYPTSGEPILGSMMDSKVNLTSSEVSSFPSWNMTPGWSWKVNVSASGDTVQLRATPGTNSPLGP